MAQPKEHNATCMVSYSGRTLSHMFAHIAVNSGHVLLWKEKMSIGRFKLYHAVSIRKRQ